MPHLEFFLTWDEASTNEIALPSLALVSIPVRPPQSQGRVMPSFIAATLERYFHQRAGDPNGPIVQPFRDLASIFCVAFQLEKSKYPERHILSMLRQHEPPTIKRYLNAFERFRQTAAFSECIARRD